MAIDTNASLRRSVIYELYVRSHTPEGTYRAVEPDLDRNRALGTDIVWLMPIHPIGVLGRKGSLGCPYANRDYRTVNPEYGTLEDFIHFVDTVHSLGMKCIIDVVYNHTSKDSTLCAAHPEFFYHKPDGDFGNRFGDWSDVNDLDYSHGAGQRGGLRHEHPLPVLEGQLPPAPLSADGARPRDADGGGVHLEHRLQRPAGEHPHPRRLHGHGPDGRRARRGGSRGP